jgi:FG-GAP-like repeat
MRDSLIVLTLTLMLTACGGGGGSSNPSTTTTTTTSPVTTTVMTYQNADGVGQVFNTTVADLNGDGLDDVVVSGWAAEPSGYTTTPHGKIPLKILIQQTDGTLKDETTAYLGSNNMIYGSQRVIVADFDGDGKPDIFVGGFEDSGNPCCDPVPSAMFWNNGSSFTRQDFADKVWAHTICIGDLYNTGRQDIVIGAASGFYSNIYVNNGNRSFTLTHLTNGEYIPAGGQCAVIKDKVTGGIGIVATNVDTTDPIVAGYRAVIFKYDSSFNYQSTVGLPGSEYTGTYVPTSPNHDLVNIVTADLNGDGQTDLILTDNTTDSHTGYLSVLINSGNFSFSNQTSTYFPGQSSNHSYSYYTRFFTINGVSTLFVCDNDANFNFTTVADMFQLNSGMFSAFDQTAMAVALNTMGSNVVYPTVYQNSSGSLYVLAAIQTSNGTYTFYTRPL